MDTDLRTDLAPVEPSMPPSCAPDNPLEALSWLGETVEEVAEGLRARGIKGRRHQADACPLATYLSQWWNDVMIYGTYRVEKTGYKVTPIPCYDFARAFDNGKFPDLIEP